MTSNHVPQESDARDLGERERLEKALRASEERFRTLVQLSFDVYWETDAEHRFTRQDFVATLLHAPAPGSEIGKTRWEVPSLEPDDEAWRQHRETLAAHLPFRDFELARPTAAGGTRHVSVSGFPVFDEDGRFLGYRGVGRDITQLKRAEAQHRAHTWFLESMDRIHRSMHGTDHFQEMINAVLEEVRDIFQSDRAVLSVLGTRSGTAWYRAALAIKLRPGCEHPDKVGLESVADEDSAAMRREVRAAGRPVQMVLGSVPAHVARVHAHFGAQSVLSMAIEARHAGLEYDHFYYFTVDECSHRRVWTAEEMRLFEEIGRRLGDALTRLSTLGELQRRDAYLSEAQRLSHTASWAWNAARNEFVHWSRGGLPLLGPDSGQFPTFEKVRQSIHPEDRDAWSERFERAIRERSGFDLEYRSVLPDGGVQHYRTVAHPVLDGSGELLEFVGTLIDITAQKLAEAERRAHVWFLESMDRINRAMQGTSDLERMMRDVLEAALEIFDSDRAWLLYPCDPNAPSWQAVMEHTRPQFPGAAARGRDLPMSADSAEVARAALDASGALAAGPGHERAVKPDIAVHFGVRSEMLIALRPKGDRPYLFGLHQCSQARTWTQQEQRLFEDIAHRLGDALSRLVAFRRLRESEARLEAAQGLAHVGWWERDYASGRVSLSDEARRIFGVEPLDLPNWHGRWLSLIHPEDRAKTAEASERALRGEGRYDVEYRVVRPDGVVRLVRSQGDVTRDDSGRPMQQFGVMQDITDLWHAQQELRARQEMLELAQKAARAVAFDWYIGARESENRWSPDLEAMYGLVPGTFDRTFQGWKKLIHPDDWPAVKLAVQHANESGDVAAEYRVIHKDGSVHWLQAKGRMFVDAEGRPDRMIGFMIDVTDRRHAEEELRATEARFRTFVDHATDAFFLHADDSTVIDVNQQACVSLGYSREQLIGMHPRQLDAGLDRPSLARIMERIGKGEPVTFETLQRRSDGTVFPVEVRARQFLHGEKRLYASLVRDTSERKRAEEDLRASEARFRTFVDRATDAFFLLDDQSTVIDVNRQACEGLGFARDELIGMHPRDFDVALDEQSISRLEERAGAGETITFETRHRRRDGTVFPVEIRSGMFRQGDRMFYLALARDITERKLAEERLRQQDHALQTARAQLAHVSRLTTLGELTSSIAHEVSQPLGGMITSAGACARWLAAQPPDIAEARAALDNIAADGKRARDVISRIRALTKRQMVRKDILDINEELLEVLALTEHESRSHGIVRRTELDRTLPRVPGDRIQLQQVLLNLIVNAIEAMSAVDDRPRLLTIVSRHDSPDVVLAEVRDTGSGLDPQRIEQVFEAFYTTKADGIGIGLSISRSIVEAHGGRLWASTNEPHGAVFRLTLPVAAAEEHA